MYSSRPERSSKYELPVMPCWSGHTPQQMEALLVLVTDGIVARQRRKRPLRRHAVSVGMSLFSMYSRPNPSIMNTTARCCGCWTNAGPARSAALEARNSRRDSEETFIKSLLKIYGRPIIGIEKLQFAYVRITRS